MVKSSIARVMQRSTTLKEEAVKRNRNKDSHQRMAHKNVCETAEEFLNQLNLIWLNWAVHDLTSLFMEEQRGTAIVCSALGFLKTSCQTLNLPVHCAHMENTSQAAKKILIYSSWAGAWLWIYASGPVHLTLSPYLNLLFSLKCSSVPLWLFLLSPTQLLLLAVGKTFQFLLNWSARESWDSLICACPPQSDHRCG